MTTLMIVSIIIYVVVSVAYWINEYRIEMMIREAIRNCYENKDEPEAEKAIQMIQNDLGHNTRLVMRKGESMTPEQIDWCQTLNGNCVQCIHQDDCEMCKLGEEE